MGAAYPELHEQRETIEMWLQTEEEAFNRTLAQGMRLLDDVIARARDAAPRASAPTRRSCCTTRTASRST